MATASPNISLTAIKEASETIINKGLLDRNFPDLKDTLNNVDKYIGYKSEIVQPVIFQDTIVFPPRALENALQYDAKSSPAGFVTDLHRTYYAVGNTLYIYDYKNRKMVSKVENDLIVGVAFIKPKANIFAEKITHVLVIATVGMIKVFPLAYTLTGDLEVFETNMLTAANDVKMKSLIGTKLGRIFMLGDDGNIWELTYRSEETWFKGQCAKLLHTSGSPWSFLTGNARDTITHMAVNESGTALYYLTAESSISVCNLGHDGESFQTVYHARDILNKCREIHPSSPLYTPALFKIISINPTTTKESTKYHLVAITSSGSRLYFSHSKNNQHLVDDTPNTLQLVYIQSPDQSVQLDDTFSQGYYKDGLFMGIKNTHKNQKDEEIITYTPDLSTLINPANRSINSTPKLIETTNHLRVLGKVITIAEVASSTEINEFTSVYEKSGRIFLALTAFGVHVLYKQRPIDMLIRLLGNTSTDLKARLRDFDSFFNHFGHVNGVSLCLGIICSANVVNEFKCVSEIPINVKENAILLLEEFGKVPSTLDPSYTSRHDGLALYMSRTMLSVWDIQGFKDFVDGVNTLKPTPSNTKDLQRTLFVFKKLQELMAINPLLLESPNLAEAKSFKYLKDFTVYTSDAITKLLLK